jgi:phi13 family phage major tail protein
MEYNEYRGVRKLVVAEITADNGTYTTGMWQELSGVQAVAGASNESSETHYYDDLAAIVVDAEGSDELTLTVSVLANKTRALIDGTSYVEGQDMLVGTPKNKKYFALGFIGGKTDGTEEINIFYKGKFSGGAETHNTKNDGTEANNVEYTFTAIHTSSPIYDGKVAKTAKLPIKGAVTETAVFGTFTSGTSTSDVLTPDELAELA